MPVSVTMTAFGGWQDCVSISNDSAELIVTTAVGPRVAFFGFKGGKNHMALFPETLGKTGGESWKIYGGHRLWHSPEAMPRSYSPDNSPIEWKAVDSGARFIQPVEPDTGIQKEIEITLDPDKAEVRLRHRLTNRGLWAVTLAVWPLTVLAPGGMLVAPQAQRDTGLLSNRTMTLWPYTRMTDPRVFWGDRFILLEQDEKNPQPFKVGIPNEEGWSAYFNHGQMFVKTFGHQMGADYPDGGCSFETYTNDRFVEMESLSPLTTLLPGAHVDHQERWALYDGIARPAREEKAVGAILRGRVLA